MKYWRRILIIVWCLSLAPLMRAQDQVGGTKAVDPPVIKTMEPKSVTQSSAVLIGNVRSVENIVSAGFKFGEKIFEAEIEDYANPIFSYRVTGLKCETEYKYYALVNFKTFSTDGDPISFITLPCDEEYSNEAARSGGAGEIWPFSEADYANMQILSSEERQNLPLTAINMDWKSGEGLILINKSYVLKTYDGGNRYILFPIGFQEGMLDLSGPYGVNSLVMTSTLNGLALGIDGNIFGTDNGGSNWESIGELNVVPPLTSLKVDLNKQRVLGVGTNNGGLGTIWGFDMSRTVFEWNHIEEYYSGRDILNSVFVDDSSKIIYGAGEKELIVKSDDGGQSWNQIETLRISEYTGWMEYLQYTFGMLLAILLIYGIVMFVRLRRARTAYLDSITNEVREDPLGLSSDNPEAVDTLNFGDTADAVVQLINNPETKPPVNIVISGAWGSGKSSMMLQIQKKLKETEKQLNKEFITAWFNIWHFQSEKHLLANFLSQILLSFEKKLGFRFRTRLFFNKVKNLHWWDRFLFWFAFCMVAPLIIFLILQVRLPYFDVEYQFNNFLYLNNLFVALKQGITNAKDLDVDGENVNIILGTGGTVLWLFSFIFMRQKVLKSGLITLLRLAPVEKLRSEVAKGDQGYREKYKKEFSEIMETGRQQNKSLVVFIDDLDRVSGDQCKVLLESINFISDTASASDDGPNLGANIYFIIGMATHEVIRNLNLELEKREKSTGTEGRAERADGEAGMEISIGAKYLEKMIDLIVQVPQVNKKTVGNLTGRG